MAYLIYGIVKDPPHPEIDRNLTGFKGKPVCFVEAHGLCAAVSELEAEEGAPPVAELLAYAEVVEALHRSQAVVPMRYGSFLDGIPAIRDLLRARYRQYETLLAELDGHVEMGIRIFLPERECENISPEATGIPDEKLAVNGRAYLALRKLHYQREEETFQDRQAYIDRYMQAFTGLYARHRTETDTKNGAVILSLYFLAPESAICRFRKNFEDIIAKENDEVILSGPWPPYNFVITDTSK
jgi:hypothetical protein